MAESPSSNRTDVLVIGAGPGGYVAAIRAAQRDLDVVLAEADAPGGTCLNYGCIPSKALLSAAGIVHEAGHVESMGIYADPYVDWPELTDWMGSVVGRLTGGVEHLCRRAGVDLVRGRATFVDQHEAVVSEDGGTEHTIAFDHAIVATGSRPIRLPAFDFEDDRVHTSRDVLSLEAIPQDVLIVGAGYIGLELATLFAKLGTTVSVLELEENVLPGWEDDLRRTVGEHVADLGVDFAFGEAAVECETGEARVHVTTENETGERSRFEAERVVVAVGREPVTDTAGLDAVAVGMTDDGFVAIDEQCRTSLGHVYAIGDVAGEPMLAHKASAEGIVAAEAIAAERAGEDGDTGVTTDGMVVPSVVFTDPEVAIVGMTETEATDAGYEVVTGRMPFSASGRALAANRPEGYVRVVVDADSETLLGAQAVGHHASELVGELGLAVSTGLTARSVAEAIHAHPTLSESVMEACAAALGEAIHVPD